MDEFVAHGATGPAASKHRLIPIQALLADCAVSRLDRKQHRLPITTSFPNTHGRSIASPPPQKQEEVCLTSQSQRPSLPERPSRTQQSGICAQPSVLEEHAVCRSGVPSPAVARDRSVSVSSSLPSRLSLVASPLLRHVANG